MPIIVEKNNKSKMMMAKVVPSKGAHEYAVGVVRRFVEQTCYNKVILRSDREPVILALKEAVRRETSVEIVMEVLSVASHQANGVGEKAVRSVPGQFRALKNALESTNNE